MTNATLNQGNGPADLSKCFTVHNFIYAVNIWRQSLIKPWKLAELCSERLAVQEHGAAEPRGWDASLPKLYHWASSGPCPFGCHGREVLAPSTSPISLQCSSPRTYLKLQQ